MEDIPQREARPSPDALLAAARRADGGRLKLFLGAAPGVGKTYEMLTAAHARLREGVDVVVGVVETHGRAETEALLAGLEVIPRRTLDYKGHPMQEMDLDAILARRPALVLVDELAHTNLPGSRHAKRHLDVAELLAAGIDVYATLNIQHLESLTDVVTRITRIRVRELVPDSVIDGADEVELIDLTPEDLIQRLKEGKVYVPQQAARAIRHYFSPGNLTALRELALRRTAQRVDAQMLSYMQAHAIRGPWPAGERLLAWVGDAPGASALVRHAKRLADQLRAPWTVLHVETAAVGRRSDTARDQVAEALRLAERLGATAATIPGQDVAETVIAYARQHNFVHVVIARVPPGWRRLWRGVVERRLIRRAGDLVIHLLPAPPEASERAVERSGPAPPIAPAQYAASAGIVLAGLLVALLLRGFLANSDVGLVFLTAVLLSAITYGLGPSLLACVLSALAYNFFFLPPLYTFTIADPENVVALFFFVLVALLAGNLAARLRAQVIAARERAKTTEDLYQFSRKLGLAVEMDDLLWAIAHQIAVMLKLRVVLLLPEGGALAVRAGFPPEDLLSAADLAAATWCWQQIRPAGRGAQTLPGAKWLFLPMRTGRGPVGVVGIDHDQPGPLSPEQHRLLDALTDQAALAIERVRLVEDLDRVRIAAEGDRLRAALLTSISHDLRTPLASILGSASSLAAHDGALDPPARAALARTIQEEAERLNRFIGNLLDMTRLEAGRVMPQRGLADLSDVVGATLRRTEKILALHRVALDLPADLPMLAIDMVLFEQVLFNLLDNAAKYAPAGTTVTVRARRGNGRVRIEVLDEGPGIPADELARIFEKFHRAPATDRRPPGLGLGLAICRGFVEAMGGTITAANRADRPGAVFTIDLPEPQPEPAAAR
ncbi:MAG: DUF4118 domain-containing protein [Acetobacteraceae bacterium]